MSGLFEILSFASESNEVLSVPMAWQTTRLMT